MEIENDKSVIQHVEDEHYVDLYPGTEIMGDGHFVKSKNRSHTVLVPQPSADPRDPLNWTKTWKTISLASISFFSFCQGLSPLANGPQIPQLMESFNCSYEQAVSFTGTGILILGFANFVWVPMATAIGRRPVAVFSTLMCAVACIWKAKASSYSSFMGAACFHGFAAATGETIQPMVVTDVLFLHERGLHNTLYFFLLSGGSTVGPIIAGSMTTHINWQSFYWFLFAINALATILLVVAFPETRWNRTEPREIRNLEARNGGSSRVRVSEAGEVSTVIEPELTIDESGLDPALGKGSPSKSQFKLSSPNILTLRGLVDELMMSFQLFIYPIVDFAAFNVGMASGLTVVISITQSQIFAAPPYNYTSEKIGLFNLALLVGMAIGLITNGAFSDWVAMKATMKNRGIREPEMRLPALIPYILVGIASNFVMAYGYQNHWDWKITVIFGYGLCGVYVASIPSIVSTYAVDCYKPVAGYTFVTITIVKNLWDYGLSKFLNNWIASAGAVVPIMVNAALVFFFSATAVIFYFFGKVFRKWSRNSKAHTM